MGIKNILSSFTASQINRDYKHRSLMLNVEARYDELFAFSLFQDGTLISSGKSRLKLTPDIIPVIKTFVDDLHAASLNPTTEAIADLQSRLSKFSDDFLPKQIGDYLLLNKGNYQYLIIEDEDLPINIPYGILFFPDRDVTNCISTSGFFLSEYYTIARSKHSPETTLKISNILTVSSNDLQGSLDEEAQLSRYFESIRPGIHISITDVRHLADVLKNENPNCLHFCCHGTASCEIVFNKAQPNNIPLNYFNLHRFPVNSLVFLNICYSAYTIYENEIPRSIANKFIDRNTQLVIMTEWPINDRFAYVFGTEFYKKTIAKDTALQAIHNIKRSATNIDDKFTALTYTLRGNPNLRLEV